VIHVVCATLFGAPVANVRAQCTKLFGKRAVAGHRVSAQAANGRTFNATGRTSIDAFLADHVGKTVAARRGAKVAAVNAVFSVLIQMMAHGEIPLTSGLIENHGQCQATVMRIIFMIERLVGAVNH
jgi:hypothetical protein